MREPCRAVVFIAMVCMMGYPPDLVIPDKKDREVGEKESGG